MKLLSFLVVIFIIAVSCKKISKTKTSQMQDIAWDYLSDYERSTATHDKTEAPVELTTYLGDKAYSVLFNTTDDELLGPIFVYIDKRNKIVVDKVRE